METQTVQPRIIRGELTKLVVPYRDKEITFAYPSFGPGIYNNVGKQILENNLQIPTADQTVALLNAAYFGELKDTPKFKEIRDLVGKSWLWIANRNLWTDKGVYVIPDPEAKGLSEKLDINKLEEMLKNAEEVNGVRFSKNGEVRFAPKETYKLECNTSDELAENGFVIASYGKQGAEKLAEISTEFLNKPYIHGLNIHEGNAPDLRCSALIGYCSGRIIFDGSSFDDSLLSHVFGVLK